MKSLKVLACAACLMGTVSGVGFAKDVQTIAGSMVVPNNVTVVSASKTNTRDFVEKQLNEESSKSTMSNMMAKEFFQNFGTNFDIYHLQECSRLYLYYHPSRRQYLLHLPHQQIQRHSMQTIYQYQI